MKFVYRLTNIQKTLLSRFPKLQEHFKQHLQQDIDYYFEEFIRKDLTDEEKQELGLIPDDP